MQKTLGLKASLSKNAHNASCKALQSLDIFFLQSYKPLNRTRITTACGSGFERLDPNAARHRVVNL